MSRMSRSLVGRKHELQQLLDKASRGVRTLVVSGPSGVGKTKLVESFGESGPARARYDRIIFCSLYRATWTSVLAQFKKALPNAPVNANQEEIEDLIIGRACIEHLLLVLDNADKYNVEALSAFIDKWNRRAPRSMLVVTAQPDVSSVLPANTDEMRLDGLTDEDEILALLGDLRTVLPVDELLDAAKRLEGNPQLLLFMQWLEPQSVANLRQVSNKLIEDNLAPAVEDLISQTSLPTLFFLALGVHKDTNVSQRLLAALWDHFGSRGAEPFIRSIQSLVDRGFLSPTGPDSYRLHESVHVNLPKALHRRVGDERVPSLHHYFAEYYRRALHHSPTGTSFSRFIHHAREANNHVLIYETLIAEGMADNLANAGMVLQVRVALESLEPMLSSGLIDKKRLIPLYLTLGQLCNALSEHDKALSWMRLCDRHLESGDQGGVNAAFKREVWYISAVAYSNTGQSDSCLQNYFRIIDSCAAEDDRMACLSLGYLAHDLKYRDLAEAEVLGRQSLDWARSFDSGTVLAKNLCSYAETLTLIGRAEEARQLYAEAKGLALSYQDHRELGRILTNWGFLEMAEGRPEDLRLIEEGSGLSKRMGDRRRYLQGILYRGLALVKCGQRVDGRACVLEAAQGFRALGDGRYFTPAVLWLSQVDGDGSGDVWSNGTPLARHDTRALVDHMRDHPEYGVYADFWQRNLADCVKMSLLAEPLRQADGQ